MTKTLVTGGLGFIGSHLIRRLVDEGHDVVNVDLNTYAGDERRIGDVDPVRTVTVDIAGPQLREVVLEEKPDLIVHLAAETHVTRSETEAAVFYRTNVEGTTSVFEAALAAGCGKVLHVSTDEVYGPCAADPFREEQKAPGEGLATSAYARSKAIADDIAIRFSDRVATVVARPTNCFGPWQHPEKAVARWCIRAAREERLPVWGSGSQVRDWMFVTDCADALCLLLERGRAGDVYNVGPEGNAIANLELARSIALAAGLPEGAVYLSDYDRPQHDVRYAVDSTKIKALGWHPRLSLSEAVAKTLDWYRHNARWWDSLLPDAEALYADSRERAPR